MAPGLLLAALLLREKKLARIALVLGLTAALACAMFLIVCIGASPDLRTEISCDFEVPYRKPVRRRAVLELHSRHYVVQHSAKYPGLSSESL